MESWFSSFGDLGSLMHVLAPIVAALFTGLAIGWLVWGGDRESEAALERIRTKARISAGVEAEDPRMARLGEVEAALAEARAMLRSSTERQDDFAQDLSLLDAAVKRVVGRISLLAKGLKA